MVIKERLAGRAEEILKNGGIGILKTDTIYGLVGSALDKKTVQRIYKVRRRNPKKPFIILIGSIDDLKIFSIKIDIEEKKFLSGAWPGKISVIVSCPSKRFFYLHRGVKTLAFRLPKDKRLIALLKKTGPLVAPSANPEGLPPANDINKAKEYFKEEVDFYVDSGKASAKPSTLVILKNGNPVIKRAGSQKIKILWKRKK